MTTLAQIALIGIVNGVVLAASFNYISKIYFNFASGFLGEPSGIDVGRIYSIPLIFLAAAVTSVGFLILNYFLVKFLARRFPMLKMNSKSITRNFLLSLILAFVIAVYLFPNF